MPACVGRRTGYIHTTFQREKKMCNPGTIVMWGGTINDIPTGWLYCDGSSVSQTTFPELFSAIGNNFGVNPPKGSFYLPDLRGRFIRGVDDGSGRDPDVNSRTDMQNPNLDSSTVGSVQSHALQDHTHSYTTFPFTSGNIASGEVWAQGPANTGPVEPPAQVSTETRPINAYLYFIIKT
jgi:microcystin-dependent protein